MLQPDIFIILSFWWQLRTHYVVARTNAYRLRSNSTRHTTKLKATQQCDTHNNSNKKYVERLAAHFFPSVCRSLFLRGHTKSIQTINHLWHGWILQYNVAVCGLFVCKTFCRRLVKTLNSFNSYPRFFLRSLHQSARAHMTNHMVPWMSEFQLL